MFSRSCVVAPTGNPPRRLARPWIHSPRPRRPRVHRVGAHLTATAFNDVRAMQSTGAGISIHIASESVFTISRNAYCPGFRTLPRNACLAVFPEYCQIFTTSYTIVVPYVTAIHTVTASMGSPAHAPTKRPIIRSC